jgi:hypothetical protein
MCISPMQPGHTTPRFWMRTPFRAASASGTERIQLLLQRRASINGVVGVSLPSTGGAPRNRVSSSMMSWHTSTHSSQIFTDGPAINLRTSFCGFWQNEHLKSPPVGRATELLPRVLVIASSCSSCLGRRPLLGVSSRRRARRVFALDRRLRVFVIRFLDQ